MTDADVKQLVNQLIDANPMVQQAATMILVSLEEDAIEPLIDEFYAGVNDVKGVAILKVMSEIGGPDALNTLRNIFQFEETRLVLKRAAVNGLLKNSDSLSQSELEEIALYIAQNDL